MDAPGDGGLGHTERMGRFGVAHVFAHDQNEGFAQQRLQSPATAHATSSRSGSSRGDTGAIRSRMRNPRAVRSTALFSTVLFSTVLFSTVLLSINVGELSITSTKSPSGGAS